MPKINLPFAVVALALVSAACTSGAATSPPGSGPVGSPSPTAAPTIDGIDHPTGPTDVVLRLEEGGGFVPIDFLANQAPWFTLYGDGRVIFQQLQDVFPQPGPDGLTRNNPWRIAQLDESQVQELLTFALGPGGLAAARESYIDNGIADAPDSIFTLQAGGLNKTVVVNALGMEPRGGPDDAARAGFQKVAERLRDFDRRGSISTDVYSPVAYRGVLIEREADPLIKPVAWPWPNLMPSDFKEGANDGTSGPGFPHRSLAADEIAALALGDAFGGVQGIFLAGPNGKTYSFVLRPLLPDEES